MIEYEEDGKLKYSYVSLDQSACIPTEGRQFTFLKIIKSLLVLNKTLDIIQSLCNNVYVSETRGRKMTDLIEITSRKQSALETLLEQMNVPAMRRDTTRTANVRWLNRNLGINNGSTPCLIRQWESWSGYSRRARETQGPRNHGWRYSSSPF